MSSRITAFAPILGLVFLGASVPAAPAQSQAGGAPDTAVVPSGSLADTSRGPVLFIRQVLVTGSRHPRAYYESPQALSFVARPRIREHVPTVSGDVMSLLPGVDMSKDSPWEQRPILRGLGGQRVLVLMDGAPVNSARGNGPHPSLIDPAQIERIEVVRGPSSVAYGSDALGGAINIITREALPDGPRLSGAATLGGNSVDRQRFGYLELMPRLGKLGAFLSAGTRRALDYRIPKPEGWELPEGPRVPHSGFKDYNVLANLRYPLSERMALKASVQVYRGDDIGLPGLHAEVPGGFLQDFRFPDYDRDAAHLTLEHAYAGGWLARTLMRVFWQREHRNFYSHEEVSGPFLPPFPPPPTGSRTRITNQDRFLDLDTWGFQTQFTSRRTDRALFTAGVDLARDRTDGDNVRNRYFVDAYGTPTSGVSQLVTASIPDGTFDNYAGFAQAEWFLAPRWTVTTGGRLTTYRYSTEASLRSEASGSSPEAYFDAMKVNETALSGSLGMVWAPLSSLHVTANVANGYRQPNAQDLFFNGPASVGTVLGNPELQPEKSISFDTGVRWGPGALALAGNLFLSTYDDLIDAVATGTTGPDGRPVYQYVNIAAARIYGAELEAEWRFHAQTGARVALAGAVGDITSPEAIQQLYGVTAESAPLPNVPPFKGTAALRWRDARDRFWIEPQARWSWRTNRLPLPTPGVPFFTEFKKEWLVGDISGGMRLPRGEKVVLGVRNLGDVTYRLPVGSILEPGRSFFGSVTVEF